MEATSSSLTLHQWRELCLVHALGYYRRRSGDPTGEHLNIRTALDKFVAFVGPEKLASKINHHQVRAWVDQLAAEGLSRDYINSLLRRLRQYVRWAADLDYLPFEVTDDLRRVRPLVAFRSPAKESEPGVVPPLDRVSAVLPHLPDVARDVLHLLQLSAARPSELLEANNSEVVIDDSGARLEPQQHKSAHHGRRRIIPLSEKAMVVVFPRWRPFCPDDPLFESPMHRGRHYSIEGLRGAIDRACRAAGVPTFNPYDVRHAVARHVRRHRGLDATQALLGHAHASTTEIYAPLTPGEANTLEAARSATEVL